MILDGEDISKKIKEELKKEVLKLKREGIYPKLVVLQVGDNESSKTYVRNKRKACEEVGILQEEILLAKDTKEETVLKEIKKLNEDPTVHGILIQSPLPKHLEETKMFNEVSTFKDVDGFTYANIGKNTYKKECLTACTPSGIITLLKEYNIPIKGAHVVILGRSNIVGKPLFNLFLNEDATVTILHSKSKNIQNLTSQADILVSAIGKPKFVKENMVKQNAVVIDVGINIVDGHIVGDVDFASVSKKASYITPVPKGIGPMTVAMLLKNVIKASKSPEKIKVSQ